MAGKKGRSGRKRNPRLPEGSRQIERRGPVVQSPDGRIVQPHWLTPGAKAIWKRTVAIVKQMRVMSTADVVALARYCTYFDQWRLAVKAGDAVAALKLEAVIQRLETQFGLTPSSRASLPAPKKEEKPTEVTKAQIHRLVG